MPTTQTLSLPEARKLVLNSQRVLSPERKGRAIEATLSAIRHLGYIQIDTISVIERAHHHTLWNRNPRYQHKQLHKLVEGRKVFEYWSHAAAYLPIEDYRYCLPRMHAERSGEGRWHTKDKQLMNQVLTQIKDEGPLRARDFEDPNPGKKAMWEWKPAKYALEQLFIEGRIMAVRREGFNKVYDLTENVLPADIDVSMPSDKEFVRFLVHSFLRAQGLGRQPEITHLRKGMQQVAREVIDEMLEADEIEKVEVRKDTWLMLPDAMEVLNKSLARSRAKILSPFDNLVIQRKRIQNLFGFDYQIECYLPADKRQYGYFTLPVLWQGKLVARMDCKAHRDRGVFEVRNLVLEPKMRKLDQFAAALATELRAFAAFNQCDDISISTVCTPEFETYLKHQVSQ
ncbi:MAG: crosslink repair DNA glycosylase YcaQ family protein [Gammaproteobacteria bacterium]|jgi:uncharacterized protein YcaQ